MVSKWEIIGVLTTAALIVVSVFVGVAYIESDVHFRGYPSPDDLQLPVMTLKQLAKYNGRDNPKILLAIKNIVFDVSQSEYYREGSAYAIFAGRDCSLMLAKWEAEDKLADLYNTGFYDMLTAEEKESLDSVYVETYEKKYPKVARLWTGTSQEPVTRYEEL